MTRTAASSRLGRGSGGLASTGQVTAGGFWARVVLVCGLVAAALVAQPVLACATVGVCGTRTIDGNTADWNLTKDLYTSMREAGRTDKSQLGNFYFTYDSSTQTGYVLVLATGTNTVVQSTADAWVKNYAASNSPIPFTAFKWVVSNGKTVGYEASFTLAPGSYSQFEVHVQIASGRTCSTGKRNTPYSSLITLKTPTCATPPSSSGTAKCGTAAVDGSIAEWDTGAASADLFSKLYQESTSLQTGNLYVRYDQATQTAYVLALASSGYVAINYLPWNWVTLDGQTVVSATSGNTASFAWVKNGTTLVGYEASFTLAPGTWQRFHAQLKTAPSNKTSNHFKATNGDQTLVANCPGTPGGNQCVDSKSATVDGKTTDWNLSADLLTPMVNQSNTSAKTADLYARYDATNQRAYVLVLARTGYVAINYLPWNFVTRNGSVVVQATSSNSPTFAWVKDAAGKLIGYEASFALANGSITNLFAQLKTAPANNTAAHFKSQGSASLKTDCTPQQYALGNQVYKEVNREPGYQPTGTNPDLPLANVTVQLFKGTELVGTKTTGADGCYLFDQLGAGGYTAVLPASQFATGGALNALRASAIGLGSDTGTDDNASPAGDHNGSQQVVDGEVRTNDFVLGAGAQPLGERVNACTTTTPDANTNLTADLALEAKPAVVYGIGNRVWFEVNGTPGFQPTGTNPDLPAIGVPVELTGPFGGDTLQSATTGADGCYLFDELSAGDYALRISATAMAGSVLNGYVPVTPAGVGNLDDNADQNGTQSIAGGEVTTAAYALGLGKQPAAVTGAACTSYGTPDAPAANLNLTADFAFKPAPVVKVALGNQVYKEVNGTAGYQTTGTNPDLPLSGVVVDLYNGAGPTGKTAITGDDGCYLFNNLDAGSYYAVLPADQFGTTGALKGLRASTIGLGSSLTTDDTADHNGSQALADGEVTSNAINLTAGNQPTGERATACTTSLPDQNTNLTLDFALEDKPITEVAIGNRVWKDLGTADGKFTQGTDQPLSGVTVTVVNNDTDASYTTTTDANGCYLVRGLSAGDYVVKVLSGQQALAGLQGVAVDPDIDLAGDDETTDDSGDQNGVQDGVGGDTQTGIYHLSPGTMPTTESSGAACGLRPASLPDANVNETADFAFKELPPPPVKVGIGDRVYFELNNVAGYQPGEDRPVTSVAVEVVDANDPSKVTSDTTDAEGCYLVEGLDAGSYYVRLAAGLFAGGNTPGALYGYTPATPFTDIDQPGQAIQDDDLDHNARRELDGTQATGAVVTGTYVLAPGSMPTVADAEVSGARACTAKPDSLPDVNVNRTADIALVERVAIGNLVWIESATNAAHGYTPGVDTPVDGVTVELDRVDENNQVLQSYATTTSNGGFYLFDNLVPGTFRLKIPGSQFASGGQLYQTEPVATAGAGTDLTDDFDNDTGGDQNGLGAADLLSTGIVSDYFTLDAGFAPQAEAGQRAPLAVAVLNTALDDFNVDLTRDFAFRNSGNTGSGITMTLGSTVWIDVNWNGVQDGDEPGIDGVTVILSGGGLGELGEDLNKTTVTHDNGNYLFTDLTPNDQIMDPYVVTIPASEMVNDGAVARALREYYGTRGLPSQNVPVQALSTKVSTAMLKTDGDNDGSQDHGADPSGRGTEAVSAGVVLTSGAEPRDGTGANDEFAQVSGVSTGHLQDNAEDRNGDMTVDFGFVHSCQEICDVDTNGVVNALDLSAIRKKYNAAQQVTPGAAHSGDCGQTGLITTNDYVWCSTLVQ